MCSVDSIASFLATGRQIPASESRCKQSTPLWAYEGLTTYFDPSNSIFKKVLDFRWRDDDILVSSGKVMTTTTTMMMMMMMKMMMMVMTGRRRMTKMTRKLTPREDAPFAAG